MAIIKNKSERDSYISQTDLLDSFGQIQYTPYLGKASTAAVADFYGVESKAIQKVYQFYKDEIQPDGVVIYTSKELVELLHGHGFEMQRSGAFTPGHYEYKLNGQIMLLNGRANSFFSKKAILRIGMLLHGSDIAEKLRSQLIPQEETEENPAALMVRKEDVVSQLTMSIATAFRDGNIMKLMKFSGELFAYQQEQIQGLQKINKELSGELLEWDNPAKVTAAVRFISGQAGISIPATWSLLYRHLLYKHHIDLRKRKTGNGTATSSRLNTVRKDEWVLVQKTLLAIAESLCVDVEAMMDACQLRPIVEIKGKEI